MRCGSWCSPGWSPSDTLAPLRARLTGGRTTHKPKAAAPRLRMRGPSGLAVLSGQLRAGQQRCRRGARAGCRRRWSAAGRWCRTSNADTTVRTHAAAEVLLDRHGVVTRGAVVAEGVPGGFAARLPGALRDGGGRPDPPRLLRRGAGRGPVRHRRRRRPGARVRADAGHGPGRSATRSCWPRPIRPTPTARRWTGPTGRRRATTRTGPRGGPAPLTVLVDGAAALFAERGGRTLLSFTDDPGVLAAAARRWPTRCGRPDLVDDRHQDRRRRHHGDRDRGAGATDAGFSLTPRGLRLRSTGDRTDATVNRPRVRHDRPSLDRAFGAAADADPRVRANGLRPGPPPRDRRSRSRTQDVAPRPGARGGVAHARG